MFAKILDPDLRYTLLHKCAHATLGRKYNIDRSVVSRWKKAKVQLEETQQASSLKHGNKSLFRIEGGGQKPLSVDMEEEIFTWILYRRFNNWVVTWDSIKNQALIVALSMNLNDFKASQGWCQRFLRRYDLSYRAKTHVSQRLPKDLYPKLASFFTFFRKYLNSNPKIHEKDIIACDETAVWFDSVSNKTIALKGEKTIGLQSTGHDKQNVTIMLSASSNGQKKRPMMVIKGGLALDVFF